LSITVCQFGEHYNYPIMKTKNIFLKVKRHSRLIPYKMSCWDAVMTKSSLPFLISYISKGERLWLMMWKVVLSISETLPWLSKYLFISMTWNGLCTAALCKCFESQALLPCGFMELTGYHQRRIIWIWTTWSPY